MFRSPTFSGRFAARALVFTLALAAMPLTSHATEEPDYEVMRKLDTVELRRYAPYVVAEVVLDSTPEAAGGVAFPILAGYIFGRNKGEKKFAMTAPVTQAVMAAPDNTSVPMTPSVASGGMRVQFVLPKGVTLASAPEPLDARVKLRAMPAADWAVIRYSGTWSQANYQQHLMRLQATLKEAGIVAQGEPVLARYDAPFIPWFMRRNEVWLALR